MFKFRKPANSRRDTDSVETIRRRAQYRLVGSAILVGVAIVVFPLIFDTEPRPLEVDLPIAIPSKDEVQPLPLPTVVAQAPFTPQSPSRPANQPTLTQPTNTQTQAQQQLLQEAEAAKAAQAAKEAQEAKAAKEAQAAFQIKQDQEAKAAAQAKQAEAARAKAILENKSASAPLAPSATQVAAAASTLAATQYPNDGKRRVIQVGSFNDAARAREVRMRLERAGITTYTQVVNSNGARFIRVRVGPFDDAQELQRFINRVEALKLEARVLTF